MKRLHWLLLLILFSLLAVLFTFPLILNAGNALVAQDVYDSYLNTWILSWQAHQLILNPFGLFDANTYYPVRDSLAFSEIILPEALLFLPVWYSTGNPILAHNLVLLALFPLNALAMYLWVFDCLRDAGAALLAGVVFAFCTYKIGELRHVQLAAAQWMPLTFLYVQKFIARPNARNSLLAALFFVLNALSSWYYAVFLSLALGLFALWSFVTRRWQIRRAHLRLGLIALVLVVVVLAPFVNPYMQVERTWQFSAQRNPAKFSARPVSYLATVPGNRIYTPLLRELTAFNISRGQPLFPGFVTIGLALLALFSRSRGRGPFGWLALVALVLSFGPHLILGRLDEPIDLPFAMPYAWVEAIPGLGGLGAPARFAVVLMFALSVLAGLGGQIISARAGRWKPFVWCFLGALVLVEHLALPIRLTQVAVGNDVPPVYQYLANQPVDQPVIEEPMGAPNIAGTSDSADSVYYSVYHWHPLVNGYSAFLPSWQAEVIKQQIDFPSSTALDQLRRLGVVWIVVHWEDAPAWWEIINYRTILASQDDVTLVEEFGSTWLYRIER